MRVLKKTLRVFKSKFILVPVCAFGLVAVGAGIGWLTIKDPPVSASESVKITKQPGFFEGRNDDSKGTTYGQTQSATTDDSTNNKPVNIGTPKPQTTYNPNTSSTTNPTTPQNPNPIPPPCDPTDPTGACYQPPACDPTDPTGACYQPPTGP
jgi:hypothetical protein